MPWDRENPVDSGGWGGGSAISWVEDTGFSMDKEVQAMSDTGEVYALLDRADELSTRDASVSGRMLLGLTVALMLASGLAEEGPPPVGLELPGTLGECIVAAADKVARWDPSMMSMPAHELSMLMPDLVDELGR